MHGGIDWLVDGHGCLPARLRDRAAVRGLLDRSVVTQLVTAHARERIS